MSIFTGRERQDTHVINIVPCMRVVSDSDLRMQLAVGLRGSCTPKVRCWKHLSRFLYASQHCYDQVHPLFLTTRHGRTLSICEVPSYRLTSDGFTVIARNAAYKGMRSPPVSRNVGYLRDGSSYQDPIPMISATLQIPL
jgi:hypothetical protein